MGAPHWGTVGCVEGDRVDQICVAPASSAFRMPRTRKVEYGNLAHTHTRELRGMQYHSPADFCRGKKTCFAPRDYLKKCTLANV